MPAAARATPILRAVGSAGVLAQMRTRVSVVGTTTSRSVAPRTVLTASLRDGVASLPSKTGADALASAAPRSPTVNSVASDTAQPTAMDDVVAVTS
jgi:hypothetical protein